MLLLYDGKRVQVCSEQLLLYDGMFLLYEKYVPAVCSCCMFLLYVSAV
jgi:hypothetical protein